MLIVLLLALAFGSSRHVLLVLLALPSTLIGGVVAVAVTGGTLTLGAMVGFVALFGMPSGDYKAFLNFLAAHECCVDFREFRTGKAHTPAPRTTLVPTGATPEAHHTTPPDGASGASVIDALPGEGLDALPAVAASRSRWPKR